MSHPDAPDPDAPDPDALAPDPDAQPASADGPRPDAGPGDALPEDDERMDRLRHDLAVANDLGEDPLRPAHGD